MKTFLLAMILFPEVQKKAQKELDNILGGIRLPEFEDEPELPYISAICKETLRWHPLLPQGVAHASSEDDIVEGYFIPKGTVIVGNTWYATRFCFHSSDSAIHRGLLHNETDFGPNIDKFQPERFLKPGVRDPASTGAFGYGRRSGSRS